MMGQQTPKETKGIQGERYPCKRNHKSGQAFKAWHELQGDATDFIMSVRGTGLSQVVASVLEDVCMQACIRTCSLIRPSNFSPDNRRDFQAPPILPFSAWTKFDIHSVSHSLPHITGSSMTGALDDRETHTHL